MKHRGSGLPRGFGFITFEDPAVVDAVILDKHVFGEKEVNANSFYNKYLYQNASKSGWK